jgi:hypothetical protein
MKDLYNRKIKQGIEFLNNQRIRDREDMQNSGSKPHPSKNCIEGFDNGPVDSLNTREINEMKDLETEMFREMQNYNTAYSNLINNTKTFLQVAQGSNPYVGKNVNINGKYGFVTDAGVFKEYNPGNADSISGVNNCPANWEDGQSTDNYFPANFNGDLFDTIPGTQPLIYGSDMKEGTGCGNEGKNIFVNQPTISTATYVNTYNGLGNSDFEEQKDLGQTGYFQCYLRTITKNKNYFALSNFDGTNGSCYVGNNNGPVQATGVATTNELLKQLAPPKSDNNGETPYMFMGFDGVLRAQDGTEYWKTTNTATPGCDQWIGGNMYLGPGSGASATYGQNCPGISANRKDSGLAGSDPLPGNLPRTIKQGNKSL